MTDSPPPFSRQPPRREPSTLDQIRDAVQAEARRASRIEAAIVDIATLITSRFPSDRPPRTQAHRERSWADDSQRIDVSDAVQQALLRQDAEENKRSSDRRYTLVVAIITAVATTVLAIVARAFEVATRGHW